MKKNFDRQKLFKKKLDYETAKKKKIQSLMARSKTKKQQILDRKRRLHDLYPESKTHGSTTSKDIESRLEQTVTQINKRMDGWINEFEKSAVENQIRYLKCIRVSLSFLGNGDFNGLIDKHAFIQQLTKMLKKSAPREFIFEITWILVNLSTKITHQTTIHTMIKKIPFILSCDPEIANMGVLLCGNIGTNIQSNREYMYQREIGTRLCELFYKITDQSIRDNIIWAFSTMFYMLPTQTYELSSKPLSILINTLSQNPKPDVVFDALIGLRHILTNIKQIKQETFKHIDVFKPLLDSEFFEIVCSSLEILSILLETPEDFQHLLKHIPFRTFTNLLESQNSYIQKYISCLFYTITLKKNPHITKKQIILLSKLAPTQELALIALANLVIFNDSYIKILIDNSLFDLFYEFLNHDSHAYVYFSAEAINKILDTKHRSLVVKKIDVQTIDKLHLHPNSEIFMIINQIFSKLNN
ncbi:importin subunit alpha-7 [Anaeramoeba flamelloides]|uniref:Importin subunit alpha-7 n=1 Tax=Anaeramoeba flamelloides TaxID=1746091 RepID=A0ABQ8X9E9_9EUKA|nr:importin subunit alpha-7 [Anaeramoeba flamelloides]